MSIGNLERIQISSLSWKTEEFEGGFAKAPECWVVIYCSDFGDSSFNREQDTRPYTPQKQLFPVMYDEMDQAECQY